MMGLSEMNMKSLRRHVNGRGTIRARKMTISATKRRNTCKKSTSKHVGNIIRIRVSEARREDRGPPSHGMPLIVCVMPSLGPIWRSRLTRL